MKDLETLYQEARTVAVLEGLTNADILLQGLNPDDQIQYIAGVGNHVFLVYTSLPPEKAKSWDKMGPQTRKFYLTSTDFFARIEDDLDVVGGRSF